MVDRLMLLAGILILLALIWMPALVGLKSAWSRTYNTIPEEYEEWWDALKSLSLELWDTTPFD